MDHGRVETRQCSVITDLAFLDEALHWAGIGSVVKIEAKRFFKAPSKTTSSTRYYISSHQCDAAKINQMAKGHWSIENKLHWVLDLVFQEDHSRRRKGNRAANFNIITKVALALIERTSHKKKSKRQRRFKAGLDHKFREKVLNL